MRLRVPLGPGCAEVASGLETIESMVALETLKRFFDCACVLVALPVLEFPSLCKGIRRGRVRVASFRQVLFRQKRVGRHGQPLEYTQIPHHDPRRR